jgi:hypothetical protein
LLIDEDGNLQMTDTPPRQPTAPLARGKSTGLAEGAPGIGLAEDGEAQQNIVCFHVSLSRGFKLISC